jgi:hypothetical protein
MDRHLFRATLGQLASTTLTKIPALNGRVSKAVKLALLDDVVLNSDGSATVASLSDATKTYTVRHGECSCRDWSQAPQNLCCHRLSAGFLRQIQRLLPADAAPVPETAPLPEARASVNCRALFHGFELQFTMRDHDENALLARLSSLLQRPDITPAPTPQRAYPGRRRAA